MRVTRESRTSDFQIFRRVTVSRAVRSEEVWRLPENRLYARKMWVPFFFCHLSWVDSGRGTDKDRSSADSSCERIAHCHVTKTPSMLPGLCQFLMRFYSELQPGNHTPHSPSLHQVPFVWSPEVEAAFVRLKQLFTSAHILFHPNTTELFTVEADASNSGVGAILL